LATRDQPPLPAAVAAGEDVDGQSHYDPGRVTVIRPARGWPALGLRDLWDYRELAFLLAWRDVKIKYKQTAVGVIWAVLQPLLTVLIFSIVFGHFARLPTNGVPYPIMTFAALLPWQMFTTSMSAATGSVVNNSALVTKVYFPRLMIPIGPTLAALVDFAIGLGILIGMMFWYDVPFGWHALTLPFFTLFAMLTALAMGIWFSALNVRYRDVQYIVPFVTQIWMYATPVAYSALLFPLWLRPWLGLNPMAGVVQGFRWALLGSQAGQVGHLMLFSFGMVIVLLAGGIVFFRRVEKSFADVI
jgi:lipopolysaccharide transport system permease protein